MIRSSKHLGLSQITQIPGTHAYNICTGLYLAPEMSSSLPSVPLLSGERQQMLCNDQSYSTGVHMGAMLILFEDN